MSMLRRCVPWGALLSLGLASAAGYTNAQYGISLTPPPGWVQREFTGLVAVFLAPKPVGDFSPNLNLLVQTVPGNITLDAYNKLSLAQLPKLITDGKVLSQRKGTLGGQPAYLVEYQGRQGQTTLFFNAAYTVVGGKAYAVTGTTPLSTRQSMTPVFQKVFQSVQLK